MNRREAIRNASLLLGAALSPATISSMLAEPTRDPTTGPRHLTALQFETVKAFAELLLPETSTPGATDVGVAQFVDHCHGGYLLSAEKQELAAGLASFDQLAMQHYGKHFAELAIAEQTETLNRMIESNTPEAEAFLRKLRELCLAGYFNSETVGRNVTNFDPIPGRFDPCISVDEIRNAAWTEG